MTTIQEATTQVAEAIEKHGAPAWVAFVPIRIRKLVPAEIKSAMIATAKVSEGWGSKQDGRNRIISWCKQNIFAEVTVKELAAIGECSEATVRTLINDRRDIFRKSDGRKYEVRDPQSDRSNNH
jgi:hypothetical protein